MKRNIKTVALFLGIGTLVVSCEKTIPDEHQTIANEELSYRMVNYSIDGVTTQMVISDDESWHSFLNWMFTLAEEGRQVTFSRTGFINQSITKDIVTFSSKDRNTAYEWADMMANDGYSVSVEYNKDTGLYDCIAIK
jgi:hypothetical protein